MKTRAILFGLFLLVTSWALAQQWPPPGADQLYGRQQVEEEEAVEQVRIPREFLRQSRGWERALAVQKETGADIFLYISHQRPPGARGLCTWWERRGMRNINVQRLLEHYIRVELNLPAELETRQIAEQFHLWEGPTVVIIRPNGRRNSIRVFDRARDGSMQLKSGEDLVELILENSSPEYRDIRL